MKKMRNGKQGFTLTEIVVVVAIIVVLATASAVGVMVTVNNAKFAQEKLKTENGDQFEYSAWLKVNSIGQGLGGVYDHPEYTPQMEEAKQQLHAACQNQILEWIDQGYSEDDILVETDSDGYLTNVKLKEGATPDWQCRRFIKQQ